MTTCPAYRVKPARIRDAFRSGVALCEALERLRWIGGGRVICCPERPLNTIHPAQTSMLSPPTATPDTALFKLSP